MIGSKNGQRPKPWEFILRIHETGIGSAVAIPKLLDVTGFTD